MKPRRKIERRAAIGEADVRRAGAGTGGLGVGMRGVGRRGRVIGHNMGELS